MTRHGYSNHDTWRLGRAISLDPTAHEHYTIMAHKALQIHDDPAKELGKLIEEDYFGQGYGCVNYRELAEYYLYSVTNSESAA